MVTSKQRNITYVNPLIHPRYVTIVPTSGKSVSEARLERVGAQPEAVLSSWNTGSGKIMIMIMMMVLILMLILILIIQLDMAINKPIMIMITRVA